jgi:hypothetical protein
MDKGMSKKQCEIWAMLEDHAGKKRAHDSVAIVPSSLGFIAGAVHGVCDAVGVPLDSLLENTLTYGPAILEGGVVGVHNVATSYSPSALKNKVAVLAEGVALGGAGGGIFTLVGYGAGYVVGTLCR